MCVLEFNDELQMSAFNRTMGFHSMSLHRHRHIQFILIWNAKLRFTIYVRLLYFFSKKQCAHVFFLSIICLLLKKVNRTFHSKVIQMCCSIGNSAEMYTCFMFLTRNRHLNDILPNLNAVKNVSSFFAVVNMCEICLKCLAYLLMPVL